MEGVTVKVHEMIATCARGRKPYELAAEIGKDGPPSAARIRILLDPDAPWKAAMDTASVRNLARVLGVSTKALWISNGESLDLYDSSEESALLALMPTGTRALKQRHLGLILPLIQWAIEDAQREDEAAASEARIAELTAQVAELQRQLAGQDGKSKARK